MSKKCNKFRYSYLTHDLSKLFVSHVPQVCDDVASKLDKKKKEVKTLEETTGLPLRLEEAKLVAAVV